MFSSHWAWYRLALGSICLSGFLSQGSAFDVQYCSEVNTADTNKNTSIYQSNGLCSGFCQQNYAFAVVQFDGCWCSNYIPDSTTEGCDTKCPGYGFEFCGGDGLFGYIKLTDPPSGTQGAGKPSSTGAQVTTVTESADPVTTVIYPTSSPSSTTTLEASSSSTESTKTSAEEPGTTDSSTETSSSWIPTPIISLETVTGQVRTVTVTPTIPPNSQNLDDISRKEGGGGLGTGGAVGLTVGLVALVAIACAIIYFCLKKRKQQQADDYNNVGARESITGLGGQVPSRTMSENSRYILGTDGRQVVETWETDTQNTPGSRTSRLMPVDPRLDPFAPVYQRGENKSRESVNTIRDDHDYSRRVHQQAPILRATNPDQ